MSGLNFKNHAIVVYSGERHVRQDQSSQNEELARDNQFLLDTLIEMDARLQKLETFSKKGNGTEMILKRIYWVYDIPYIIYRICLNVHIKLNLEQ